jgi:hypothetical protein
MFFICFLRFQAVLGHTIYTFKKHMHIQSQQGQTKVHFYNQGKNATLCIAFWFGIFLFEYEKHMLQRVENVCKHALKQRSQTRGPREGPMRPANI